MDDNSKKRITEHAVRLFRERGYENVSVNDICKAAGIARSTFYLTFSGKKDIIEKMLADVRLNRDEIFSEFISAKNDFERMWILCCRYLAVAETNGPEVTGALLRLDLMCEINILDGVHTVDDWFVQMTRNAMNAGVLLSPDPPEVIAPIGVDIAYYTTYEWCKRKGSFNLRQAVRRRAEAVYNIAPQYRMSDEELAHL